MVKADSDIIIKKIEKFAANPSGNVLLITNVAIMRAVTPEMLIINR